MALLPLPEPYDFELSTERFRAFGADFASMWHEDGLHRVGGGREVRIEAAPGGVSVEPGDDVVLPEVRKLLGAEFDLDAFYAFAESDEVLARIVPPLRGFRPPLATDPFESLVTSITAQQVSLFAAFAIRNRMVAHFAQPIGCAFPFPSRGQLAEIEPGVLVGLGFSQRKAEYVVGLARADFDYDALAALPDDVIKERLVALRGIGEWTADWFLARHLARPRAWPAGDLAVRKAVEAFYGPVDDIRAFGARFDPFQNLTAHYLLVAHRVLEPL